MATIKTKPRFRIISRAGVFNEKIHFIYIVVVGKLWGHHSYHCLESDGQMSRLYTDTYRMYDLTTMPLITE